MSKKRVDLKNCSLEIKFYKHEGHENFPEEHYHIGYCIWMIDGDRVIYYHPETLEEIAVNDIYAAEQYAFCSKPAEELIEILEELCPHIEYTLHSGSCYRYHIIIRNVSENDVKRAIKELVRRKQEEFREVELQSHFDI